MNTLSADLLSLSMILHAALWGVGWLIFSRVARLDKTPIRPLDRRVTVIIPARNEEARLPDLLASLANRNSLTTEIIVVDDHSTDQTARLARESGARVVSAPPLPEGWRGKTWACFNGAQAAQGDLLIFLDADIRLEPSALERLNAVQSRAGGVLSVQPYHRVERAYEQLSAFFNLVQMMASRAFTLVGQKAGQPLMFGPCLVITKADYDRSGGHEAVKGEILENFRLSHHFRRHRIPVRCFSGEGLLTFRMYPDGIRDLVNGWSKAFGGGALGTDPGILLLTIAWFTGCLGTARHLLTEILARGGTPLAGVLGIFTGLYVIQIAWMLRRAGQFSFLNALLYPLPMIFFVLVFLRSLILRLLGKTVSWKGRSIST